MTSEQSASAAALVCGLAAALAAAVPAWATPSPAAPMPTTTAAATPAVSAADGHRRMVEALAAIAAASRDTNPYIGDLQARQFRALVADPRYTASPRRHWTLLRELGFHELRLGNDQAAIARLEEAWALVPRLAGVIRPEDVDRTQLDLAVAWLRFGERQNCVARHTSASCILPIEGAGVHQDQEGSRRGMTELTALLDRTPDHLPARWLLNVAAMTVGDYPDGVPEKYRIPPATFVSAAPFARFTDVAPVRGVNTQGLMGGVAVEDYDGDGVLDVVVSSVDPGASLRYFAGHRDGTLTERSAAAGFTGITGGMNVVQGDVDGDGAIDLLVLRGAWLDREGRQPKSLLKNDGHGVFTDVTFAAGLGAVAYPSATAAFADYDGDGDLDLYVGNEWTNNNEYPSELFRNEGNGTFVDVAATAGVENRRLAKGVAWLDADEDGRPDLYVANLNGDNRLYRNRGDGTFEDVAPVRGVVAPWSALGVATFDYDGDGHLDLFVGATSPRHLAQVFANRTDELASLRAAVASLLGRPFEAETGRLYRGLGDGRFTDVTAAVGLRRVLLGSGLAVGDLDGDGWEDLHLGKSYPGYEGLLPNLLFRNRQGQGFADVTTAAGLGHLQKAGGIVIADLDADGDQDVFVNAGGTFAGDVFGDVLFANPGNGTHWLGVRLRGVRSNRQGIGAHVRATVRDGGRTPIVHQVVGAGSSFGASPLRRWIGLGSARRVATLEVTWPTSGTRQVFHDVPADRVVTVTEGVPTLGEDRGDDRRRGAAASNDG